MFCDIDRLCVKGSCGWSRYGDMDFAVDYLDDVSVGSVLSFAKRRDDVLIYERTGDKMRLNIARYNLEFINMAITLVGVIVVVCYIMYTVSPEVIERMGTSNLYLTTIWVLAGILRYLQLTVVDKNSGSPTKILIHDRFIHVCIVGWVLSFGVLIYFEEYENCCFRF